MKAELLQFVATEILSGWSDVKLRSSDDLLTSELIDSMGVMRLIAFIESTYSVKIPPEDVTIEHFITIDAICDYLSRRDRS
jgi:acyl carrier protein